MNNAFVRNFLGSKKLASEVAQRAQTSVPAYKKFLQKHGFNVGDPFENLPKSDKETYAKVYLWNELLADDYEECFSIIRSSGSSGHKFYWPQMKSANRSSPAALKNFLENAFAIHQKKTLAIVGLSLGSWLGGDTMSWSLKSMAVDTTYPFFVFSPGNNLDEIIETINSTQSLVEQIILFVAPSAIAYLQLKATELKQPLPLDKIKYVVVAEPFAESLRASLQKRAGVADNTPFMYSLYGSADTGTLGVESQPTIALRKLLYQNSALASELGIESPIPNFFHFLSSDTFLETVDGHLCVTRWQGIPIVRYIVYDRVSLYKWKELRQAVLNSKHLNSSNEALIEILSKASEQLPDLLAVTGRADKCLIVGGSNFTEYILDAAVKCEELDQILTGLYRAKLVYEEDRQYLAFDLEIRQDISPEQEIIDRVYYSLINSLGQFKPSFRSQWQNIYSAWDNHPTKRVLKLNFIPWPGLSELAKTSIKQRGIIN
ncbi:hypothetical protein [Calothrix sp. CCY 0018]|uniref:hypothetical protein n=1 Tax=Calothrix sp. CCY 0018 TaxID=3103864 RepID=UPI0039C5E073